MSERAGTTRKRVRLASLLLGLGLAAAACGGDDTTSTGGAASGNDETESTTEESADTAMEDESTDDDATEDAAMEDEAMEDEAMEDGRPILDLSFEGLESLGGDFDYEVWSIVGGEPVSGGIFDLSDAGAIEISTGDHLYAEPEATAIVVTIEPSVGDDPAPSDTHVLAGDVADDGTVALTIDHEAALGTDFADAAGSFVLATPTNDPDGDELAGVWFLSVPGPEASLDLPTLPAGWAYEGWAVIDGIPVTTGRFLTGDQADDFSGFSGPNAGPNYPGEDFITNAPDGLTFPTDLTGRTIVISVEPDADNDPAPFALKPLLAEVPDGIGDHENVDLGPGSVAISGSATIVG